MTDVVATLPAPSIRHVGAKPERAIAKPSDPKLIACVRHATTKPRPELAGHFDEQADPLEQGPRVDDEVRRVTHRGGPGDRAEPSDGCDRAVVPDVEGRIARMRCADHARVRCHIRAGAKLKTEMAPCGRIHEKLANRVGGIDWKLGRVA